MNRVIKQMAAIAGFVPLITVPAAAADTIPVLTFSPLPGAAKILGNPLLPPDLFPPDMTQAFRGAFCSGEFDCMAVVYSPLSIPEGEAMLRARLETVLIPTAENPDGRAVVFAYSQGGQVVQQWMKHDVVGKDPANLPPADKLSFVLYGNSTRKYGGSLAYGFLNLWFKEQMPATQYRVLDISRQYDYASDFPDDPFNQLALWNAIMGALYIHGDYRINDPFAPANAVWTEGNITYVLIPTEKLPLLEPLRRMGLTALADSLNDPLKALVELGYRRPAAFGTQPSENWADEWRASDPADPNIEPDGAMVQLNLEQEPGPQTQDGGSSGGEGLTALSGGETQNGAPQYEDLNGGPQYEDLNGGPEDEDLNGGPEDEDLNGGPEDEDLDNTGGEELDNTGDVNGPSAEGGAAVGVTGTAPDNVGEPAGNDKLKDVDTSED